MRFLIFILFFVFVSSSQAFPLYVVDDAYIHGTGKEKNRPHNKTYLEMQERSGYNGRYIYLKFDIRPIKDFKSTDVYLANLRLYIIEAKGSGAFTLKKLDNQNWSEETITLVDNPGRGVSKGNKQLKTEDNRPWDFYFVDVTSLVQEAVSANDDYLTLVLTPPQHETRHLHYLFASKERGSYAPQIDVILAEGEEEVENLDILLPEEEIDSRSNREQPKPHKGLPHINLPGINLPGINLPGK